MFRDEAGVDVLQRDEAAHEETRAREEHQRQGNFGDNQDLARSRSTGTARSASGIFQRVSGVGA